MTEFSDYYKNGINCLHVPEHPIEELRSLKQHKKYVRRKKMENLVAAVFFIFLFSIVASATAYAAYTIHKNVQFTSYGLKIDFSDPEKQSDPDEVVSYADVYGAPAYSQEDSESEVVTEKFDSWDDALKVFDFPIVYPQNIQYSELDIEYCQLAAYKLVQASYIALGRVVTIRYDYHFSGKWSFAIDYNTSIIDNYVYTNKYGYDFWITVCQYGNFLETKAVTYTDNCTIQISFHGYEDNEIDEVLEELDLSVYE